MIVLPAVWVFVAFIFGVFYVAAVSHASGTSAMLLTMLYAICAITAWVALLGLIWRRCGGWPGVGYALVSHIALAAYIGGIMIMVAGMILTCVSAFDTRELFLFFMGLLILSLGVAPLMIGRKAEKAVAAHCIRLHLKRRVTS